MKIFVLNLKRRPDRLAEITEDLIKHGLTFEIIEANAFTARAMLITKIGVLDTLKRPAP